MGFLTARPTILLPFLAFDSKVLEKFGKDRKSCCFFFSIRSIGSRTRVSLEKIVKIVELEKKRARFIIYTSN